jgi:hypothetical protein
MLTPQDAIVALYGIIILLSFYSNLAPFIGSRESYNLVATVQSKLLKAFTKTVPTKPLSGINP